MSAGVRGRARGWLVALAVLTACTRHAPDPDADEQAALAAAHALPAEPSAGCRSGDLPAVSGARASLPDAGGERTYLLDAPAVPADRPLPIVFTFHGFRSTAWRHRWWTGWGGLARHNGFVAVTPEGHSGVELLGRRGRGWDLRPDDTRDATWVRELLDHLERERCIDRRRVFATGMSNGGFFANLLGCVLADRVAAIAPVAGGLPLRACAPARPVPVLLVYGSADRVVPAGMVQGARDWWAATNGCGSAAERGGCAHYAGCRADVVYCEGQQAHSWPPDATERIWRFFDEHPRS